MNISSHLHTPRVQTALVPALQDAIKLTFSAEDWRTVGFATGTADYINQHTRLLRSLSWGDADYGDCVYQVLQYCVSHHPGAIDYFVQHPKIRPRLEKTIPHLLAEFNLLNSSVAPVPPAAMSAGRVVELAIGDADHLLATSGPINCVDRLHTAFHGYLRHLCREAQLTFGDEASVTQLFKILREAHPKLRVRNEVDRVLSGMATSIDALNTLRNRASLAHPSEQLLDDADAHLVVNFVRSLFHYLQQRIGR